MLIAYGSLYPWHFVARDLGSSPFWILLHSGAVTLNRYLFRDVVVNVVLYVPAGLTGHLAFRRFGKWWLSLLAPLAISAIWSASIEMAQLFDPSRTCSLLDLATNIIGSGVGVVMAIAVEDILVLRQASGRAPGVARGKPADRASLALLACWIVGVLFPLFPVMGRTVLGHKLAVFAASPFPEVLPLLSAAAAWFAAGSLFRAGSLRPARPLLAISVLMVPAQFFIVDRQPSMSELAGALIGAVCFAVAWPSRNRYFTPLTWTFVLVIVIRGLAPFDFGTASPAFSWIPFGGFLAMDWQAGVQLIAEKVFWYGTAIWLLLRTGMRLPIATALMATVLLAIEAAQTHLPGHIAELTDPILAGLLGLAFIPLLRPARDS